VFINGGFKEYRSYRYWNAATKSLDLEGMLEDLRAAPENAVIILHACAHNPTGLDPTHEQWEQIANVVKVCNLGILCGELCKMWESEMRFVCSTSAKYFFSILQNLLGEESLPTLRLSLSRICFRRSGERFLGRALLCGKKLWAIVLPIICKEFRTLQWELNYLLVDLWNQYHTDSYFYHFVSFILSFIRILDERVGNLTLVSNNSANLAKLLSQITLLIRGMYSNPPSHGARVVATALNDPDFFEEWKGNIKTMSDRIKLMRTGLRDKLVELNTPGDWSHIVSQIGMFSYTGLNRKLNHATKLYVPIQHLPFVYPSPILHMKP